MRNHPDIDREIGLLRRAIRRLAFEGSGEATPTLSFDVGYGWTLLSGPEGGEPVELWVRTLAPPFDYDDVLSVLLLDWRAGSFGPHKHREREAIHCLHGRLAVSIEDGPEEELGPGEAVVVPALVRHTERCVEGPCLVAGVYSPALPLLPNPQDS